MVTVAWEKEYYFVFIYQQERKPMRRYHLKSFLALAALSMSWTHLAAQTIGTWYAESNQGSGVGVVSDSDTISLTNTSGTTARIGAVASLGQSFSFTDVGDYVEFTGDYSGSVGNNINYAIRIGFYDSTGLSIDSNFDDEMDDLIGFHGAMGNRSTTGARTGVFSQGLNADQVLALNQSTPGGILGSAVTPISTGSRTMTYRVERVVGDLLEFRFTDGVNVDITRTLAVGSAPTLNVDSIAVGFILSNNNSATFDNISIAIPEPGTLALVGIALGSLLVFRRRL
jgi:hypothetical protein